MDPNIKIRVFQLADEHAVIALWQEVFGNESHWNAPSDVIRRKLQVQPDLFYVAEQDGGIIGTVIAGFDGVRGWVHRLAVQSDYRRQGIASQLMRRAEAGLKELGCAKLNLQVRASNLDVVRFYESLGFAVEERASLGKPLSGGTPSQS